MDILTGRFGPREIAFAAAFGVFLGLLPKDNLLFVLAALVFLFSHANIVLGLVVTAVVSFFAPWIHEAVANSLGGAVLISPFGQKAVAALHGIPGIPWMKLDNTVVMGSLLLGATLFFPIFFLVWIPLKIFMPKKKEEKEEKKESVTK